jgi:hypothetical protein
MRRFLDFLRQVLARRVVVRTIITLADADSMKL